MNNATIHILGTILNNLLFFVVVSLVSKKFDAISLAFYFLLLRYGDVISNIISFGLPISIRKYISSYDSARASTYFNTSALLITFFFLLLILVAEFSSQFTQFDIYLKDVFGLQANDFQILILYAYSTALSFIVNSYLMADKKYAHAIYFDFVSTNFLTYIVFVFSDLDIHQSLIFYILIRIFLIALLCKVYINFSGFVKLIQATEYIKFTLYGLRRCISPILETLIPSILLFMISQNPKIVTAFSICTMLIRLPRMIISPISMYISVEYNRNSLYEHANHYSHNNVINIAIFLLVILGLLATLISLLVLRPFLELWLSNESLIEDIFYSFKICVFSIPFICVSSYLRDIIDLTVKSAVNFNANLAGVIIITPIYYLFNINYDIAVSISLTFVFYSVLVCFVQLFSVRKFLNSLSYFINGKSLAILIFIADIIFFKYYATQIFDNIAFILLINTLSISLCFIVHTKCTVESEDGISELKSIISGIFQKSK